MQTIKLLNIMIIFLNITKNLYFIKFQSLQNKFNKNYI